MKAAISNLENILPNFLNNEKIQWIPWGYALWQLLRRNTIVIFTLSFFPFLARRVWRKQFKGLNTRLVAIVPTSANGIEREWNICDGDEYFSLGHLHYSSSRFSFQVMENQPSWPSEMRVVKFNGWVYFTTKVALDLMAKWLTACSDNEQNAIFINYPKKSIVGEEISIEEACEKILSGGHFVLVKLMFPTPTWIRYVELNDRWGGFFSTVPTLLQTAGYYKCSILLSFIIILLDLNRGWINSFSEYLFLKCRLYVKVRVSWNRYWGLYLFMAFLFSNKWASTFADNYVAKRGTEVKLCIYSKLRRIDDVTVNSGGQYNFKEYDSLNKRDCDVIQIWGDRGLTVTHFCPQFMFREVWITRLMFVNAVLNKSFVVEHH